MTPAGRALLVGTGVALAVSLPAALVAQVAAGVLDDELPDALVVGLALVALAGGVAGGWVVGARRASWPAAVAAGALALVAVAALGVLRRVVAGESHGAGTVVGAAGLGALAGGAGWALARARAARTRS
ncbi:MAG: hypothetical protein ACLGI8_00330 [Acidimicrobiia bacterium]